MGKIVNETHVIAERGVIKFHDYCNNHFPYICFREVLRNDFGIDGEVELVRINEDGKKEMTGELLKVQIKSSFGTGYIRKRTDGSFSFNAKKADLEYWSKHELGVLLIIYDDEVGSLHAKKIKKEDYLGAKKKSYPIDFSNENKLEKGSNDFVQRFSAGFRMRVSHDSDETLTSNLLYIKKHPRSLFFYESKFSKKEALYKEFKNPSEAPFFTIYGNKIITVHSLSKNYKSFVEFAISDENPTIVNYDEIKRNQVYRRNLIEVLNIIFKDFVSHKGIYFNKDYKRYYFSKSKDSNERSIDKTSIKTGKTNPKKVVSYHEYGKDKFFRHKAFEIDYIFEGDSIYITLLPKYLFTVDGNGKNTLAPAKITKYTNYLTSREWNDQVLEQIYQILNFLTNSEHGIDVLNTEEIKFSITRFIHQDVKFGIPSDIPTVRKSKAEAERKKREEESKQTSFFK